MSIELKLCEIEIQQLCRIVGGKLEKYGNISENAKINALTTSSLDVTSSCMFCAIKGERVDGNAFVKDAIKKGAICILSENSQNNIGDELNFFAVIVDNVVTALGKLASWYRLQSKTKVVAVTGSVGKTTTKEMIYSVLNEQYKTHKTSGNYNNELGLPLTIFGLEKEIEYSVLELGMSERGEIEYLSNICRPDISVITIIGTSHIANLGSRENISLAKLEIVSGMSGNGKLIINGDEPLLTSKTDKLSPITVKVGVEDDNNEFKAINIKEGATGVSFDMKYQDKIIKDISTSIPGRHNVFNAMFAYVIGLYAGISEEKIKRGIASYSGIKMRQNIYNIDQLIVIDDCYNASPESMKASLAVLDTFSKEKKKKSMALLGDMLELGDLSEELHRSVGAYTKEKKPNRLFCYGPESAYIADEAIKNGFDTSNIFSLATSDNPKTMADEICRYIDNDTVLLVKASRGTHAEAVIDEIRKNIIGEEA